MGAVACICEGHFAFVRHTCRESPRRGQLCVCCLVLVSERAFAYLPTCACFVRPHPSSPAPLLYFHQLTILIVVEDALCFLESALYLLCTH
eukprot:3529288-Pleurochrysis_carterae.AAC.3